MTFKNELIDHWSDIDDITHNDILLLSYGIGNENSGITAYEMQRHVVADDIKVAYSYSGDFNTKFENLLRVSIPIPNMNNEPSSNSIKFNSHGTTEIRRYLNIKEQQLPAIYIICYRDNTEYLIELSSSNIQLSPVKLIYEISKNLDDKPFRFKKLDKKNSEMYEFTWQAEIQIRQKRHLLHKMSSGRPGKPLGQLESALNAVNESLYNAPQNIKEICDVLTKYLTGEDYDFKKIMKIANELFSHNGFRDKRNGKISKALKKRFNNIPFEPASPISVITYSNDEIEKVREELKVLEKKLFTHEENRNEIKKERNSIKRIEAFKESIEKTIIDLGLQLSLDNSAVVNENSDRYVVSVKNEGIIIQKYDIAVSFAGEDREYVEEVANVLLNKGIEIFYDKFLKASLWGQDLYEYLDEIYRKRAKYCIIFISKHYNEKLWTNHERKSAQARVFRENKEYILPVRFDNTTIPGILETTGYIDANTVSPQELAELVIQKLKPTQSNI